MIALLQRVSSAQVVVDGHVIGSIGAGLLVLVGVEAGDTAVEADRLLDRLLDYRVFTDEAGKMNLSLRQIQGGLLLVPQFTLAADTRKGLRPGFSTAAAPETGKALFEHMLVRAQQLHPSVARGEFGAHMQVSLTNDGPVTFWLQVKRGA
ncbi:MAG: D-aminoacyl-tRNA deacylase [Burkholderiales bacterium]